MLMIPIPKEISHKSGHFQLLNDSRIILDAACNSGDLNSALSLQQEILHKTGLKLPVSKAFTADNRCIF